MNVSSLLDRAEYFRGVDQKSRELLAAICVPKKLKKKELLFTEGQTAEALYLLISGAVGILKATPDGREVVIKVIQPGEVFAEVVLFKLDRYPVTAVAMAPSVVLHVPKQRFYRLLDHEDFRNDFILMLMKKQRYLVERIRYLTMHDVEDRFFRFLEEHHGASDRIVPILSKKDIAAAIGTTPETYSRLLARLSREGRIQLRGKAIEIKRVGSRQ
jgi:CRP-like cAMP-binding protein